MDSTIRYLEEIRRHYTKCWESNARVLRWDKGPIHELPLNFSVLCFEPRPERKMWTYATCGMSLPTDPDPVELHLFAPQENGQLVELVTAICHFHRHGSFLHHGETVNFGRPWLDDSLCEYGLISRPYLDGPSLEWIEINSSRVRFLWLIPITKAEREYKKQFGLEALEAKLEAASFDYINPARPSVL
jgi:Suppressor of fused protein (SUFU)